MELKITGATLPGRTGLWDIAIANGYITDVAACIPQQAAMILNVQGQLVIPGLVDAHMHLDKALLSESCSVVEDSFDEAMRETSRAKQSFTVADIQTRARRAIENAIALLLHPRLSLLALPSLPYQLQIST